MTLEQEKKTAKYLDSRLDDKTAAEVEKWNLALLGMTLAHDADHILQARRWHYQFAGVFAVEGDHLCWVSVTRDWSQR